MVFDCPLVVRPALLLPAFLNDVVTRESYVRTPRGLLARGPATGAIKRPPSALVSTLFGVRRQSEAATALWLEP